MTTTKTLIATYSVGATLASTAVSEGAMVLYSPGPDGFLTGNDSSDTVDRAQISFDVGGAAINYARVNTSNATTIGALTISPNYEFKPIIGSPVTRDGEARSNLAYQTFLATPGEPIDSSSTFNTATTLDVTPSGYLGVNLGSLIGDGNYGWIEYAYDGTNVSVIHITFETIEGEGVIAGIIPESSTVITIVGAILTGGLIGIRRLRARKNMTKA